MFAGESIAAGELVEACPVITISKRDLEASTVLDNYYFVWNDKTDSAALALGYGSLYNHSWEPNVECYIRARFLDIEAIRDIEAGEELLHNYDPESDELWFDVV